MSLKSYYKTTIEAGTLQVAGQVAVSAIGGAAMLAPDDVTNTTITNKIVTPAALKYLLTSPPDIGTVAPNTGNFTSITAATVGGAMIASDGETIAYAHIDKAVPPKGLKAALLAPPPIGTGLPAAGVFTTVCGQIAGRRRLDSGTVVQDTAHLTLSADSGFAGAVVCPECLRSSATPGDQPKVGW
jgi:hypothetical protein